jgi:hypothetical protein
MVFFAAIVFGGTNVSSAADLSKVGSNWEEDDSIRLISSEAPQVPMVGEVQQVGLMNSVDYMSSEPMETTLCGNGGGCCPTAPCDWLRPCGGWFAEYQNVWLRPQGAEPSNAGSTTKYNSGQRFIFGHMNSCGNIWRGRYFNYAAETSDTVFNMAYADFEHARRFAWAGGIYGELSAGLRWAEWDEADGHLFTETIGPVFGGEIRGGSILNWNTFAAARHSIQFGHERRQTDGFGTFSISEMQLGMVRNVSLFGHQSFVKGFFEAQYWAGAQEGDTSDLGLVGLGAAFGTTF